MASSPRPLQNLSLFLRLENGELAEMNKSDLFYYGTVK